MGHKPQKIPWMEIIGLLGLVGTWYMTIYPFGGSYTIDDISMNFFALVIFFTMVFSVVLNMLEDHRLALLTSLSGVLELLIWERMMGLKLGSTIILLYMGLIFLISYKHYPKFENS